MWLIPLFRKGARKRLDTDDIYDVPKGDETKQLGDDIERAWNIEIKLSKNSKKKPSVLRALVRCFGFRYMLLGLISAVQECVVRIGQSLLMGELLRFFQTDSKMTLRDAYLYGTAMVVCNLLFIMVQHAYFFQLQHTGMKLRIACCVLLYRKALKLSQKALGQTTIGQMVNLMSNDVNRFDMSVLFVHYLWIGPLQMIVVFYFLYGIIGMSCLAGLVVILSLIPLQAYMGKLFSGFRQKTARLTDERVRAMNEIIVAIRVIKMYAWEESFAKIISDARKSEIEVIRKIVFFRALNMSIFFTATKFTPFISLVVFALTGNQLTATAVFLTLSLYNNVRNSMTMFVPYAISHGAETLISIKRIEDFMGLEEREIPVISNCDKQELINKQPDKPRCRGEQSGIIVEKLVAKWTQEQEHPIVNNLSFTVKPGQLLVVVGAVGSGKTSLLMSLLRELPSTSGKITINGKVAYASQEPWVFSSTVRENILFHKDMDYTKYRQVIRACGLSSDIKQWERGDETMVGERGTILSGGQRARVNLARAVYSDSEIYLLDDPLSAVDAHVSHHLFYKCIKGYLKDKVVILATHQLQFLKNADRILVLKNGNCLGYGTYQQLINQGIDFTNLIDDPADDDSSLKTAYSRQSSVVSNGPRNSNQNLETIKIPQGRSDSLTSLAEFPGIIDPIDNDDASNSKLESTIEGSVSGKVYWRYIKTCGGGYIASIIVSLYLVSQFAFRGSDVWLSKWTESEERFAYLNQTVSRSEHSNDVNLNITDSIPAVDPDRMFNLYVYSGLVASIFVFCLVRGFLFFFCTSRASILLHDRMFNALIRAPVRFFDTNPSGRLMNRFSKDIGLIDDMLPMSIYDCLEIFAGSVGIIIVVTSVNPWIIIPAIFALVIFVFIRRYYLLTARDIKRLEGISRSPVYSHLSSSLQGISTIRAFKAEACFREEFNEHQDLHSATWFLFLSTARFLGIVLDIVCSVFLALLTYSLIWLSTVVTSSAVGLALTNAVLLAGLFQFGVKQSTEVENQMISVERVLEYGELEEEGEMETSKKRKPPKSWPEEGTITLEHVYLHYSENDRPVLKNLNCTFNAGEKIGIVGRTGAGKSSLIMALFRLAEPRGNICIDGIVTSEIGIHDLRKKISIIPQEPILFTGTMRKNLDPFGEYKDHELWSALEDVQLKDSVSELPGNLDAHITEGGSNFSMGQRQLVCLARAILKKNKILLLDEATANVDPATDSLIQDTVRTKFHYCTVLTIAHRLNTIMDSDRVMVMHEGRIAQFDDPFVLLQDTSGIFYSMVQQTGTSSFNYLREMARLARQKRESRKLEETVANFKVPSIHDKSEKVTGDASIADKSEKSVDADEEFEVSCKL